MNYALAINIAVNLIVGLTLLLAWRRDRAQMFSRDIGWAYLSQMFIPLMYLAMRQSGPLLHAAGAAGMVLFTGLYLSLLLLGIARLAGLPLTRQHEALLLLGLVLFSGMLLYINARLAQSVMAAIHIASGLVATAWLWRLGAAERLTGLMLMLIGFNQYIYVVAGEPGLALQATLASLLRLTLGFALLQAAIRRSTEESRHLRDRFQHLTEHSHQGMAVVQGEDLKYANPAFLRIYGLSSLEGVGTRWRDVTMPEAERSLARERHQRIIHGELAQASWQGLRYRFDGMPIHLRFSSWRIEWDGQPAEQVVVTDETAQHDATRALLYQATHDVLTGLPNRGALLQRLRELCAEPGSRFALLLLDVDRFKLFNEAHGPSLGDRVLQALAATLQRSLAHEAQVMRLGEDEFALLAQGLHDEAAAGGLAQRVRMLLAQPLVLQEHTFFLDVSMGIALHPGTTGNPEALLRAANAAMHQAKQTPGTSLQFAEERFERGSGAVLDAEQALRSGVTKEEFVLFYQPKVAAGSALLVGFEALVRWDRPGLGQVSPLEFIPVAERTGLIGPLGALILAQACEQLALWRSDSMRMVPVAVNVSPLQLVDPGFPDMVLDTLRKFNVPPSLLTLEITESAAVTHLEQARSQMRQLREYGIDVALDDFGTGFSSLNLLRSLPLGTVKIDRALIEPMPARDATAVVKAICDLAAVLNLDVVAEGIETSEQAAAAQGAGCQVLQGSLYAQPLSAEDAARWLKKARPSVQAAAHA